jgi:exosortase E/protease (VPEID-CTERM system)
VTVVFLANTARIVALIELGAHVDPAMAVGGFHSKAGWVLFCAIALGVAAFSRRIPWFFKPGSAGALDAAGPADNPTAGFLMPLLTVVATAMVTGMFSSSLDRFYGLRIVTAGVALVAFRAYHPFRFWPRTLDKKTGLAVLAGVVAFALWLALYPNIDGIISLPWLHTFHNLGPLERTEWLVLRVVGSVLLVPMVEELAFRGYALRRLTAVEFTAVAYEDVSFKALALSSIAFGVLHQAWIAGTLVGVLYGALAKYTGRLADAVLAHAVTNALVAFWAIGFEQWTLWM